jgi:hypothetical protein
MTDDLKLDAYDLLTDQIKNKLFKRLKDNGNPVLTAYDEDFIHEIMDLVIESKYLEFLAEEGTPVKVRRQAHCTKCENKVLGDEDGLCGNCAGEHWGDCEANNCGDEACGLGDDERQYCQAHLFSAD